MKSVLALALVVGSWAGTATAQPRALDPAEIDGMRGAEPPQVLLLTFGVGERIFEKFGHAALCLNYSDREPVCFNYGVTDFEDGPSMIWGFVRSRQKFWVDPEGWSDMIGFYQSEDRDIYEQVLPLSPAQARSLETEILSSLEEGHRYYHYDHFFNNCTTRLRDLIDRASGGRLSAGAGVAYPLTFRELGVRGIAGLPPLVALTDFVIGRPLDATTTLWAAMFHPAVLREHVTIALGVVPRQINHRHAAPFPTTGSTWRAQMFGLALVFALPLLVATWRRRYERLALVWATIYLALWGVVIWTLVAVSTIPALRWNEVMLVLVPFDAALPLLGAARRRRYARIRVAGLLLVSTLCALGVLHQPLWIPILSALVPLAIVAFDQKIAPPRV